MATKRMFTKEITNSSNFIKMSSSAQALYFHLNMASDDDGFCNEVDTCMFRAKASEDDLKVLIAKKFILTFNNSDVVAIKGWRMNNTLRKDRYSETKYQDEKSQLFLKDNGSYTFNSYEGKPLLNRPKNIEEIESKDSWQPNGNQMATEISKDKISIGKDSIVENSKDNKENKINREKDVHTHDYKSLLTNNIKVLEQTKWNDLDCDTKNEIFSLLNKTKNIEESSTKELFTKLNKLVNLALFHDENGEDKNGEDCLPF